MANNSNTSSNISEEAGFSFKDFIVDCLSSWKWFVISIIVCVGLGILYYVTRQPVYSRYMLVLIQDDEGGSGMSMSNAFKDFGLGGASTNVYNEMVSLASPAVMYEVVNRLQLYAFIEESTFPHNVALYKSSCPFDFVWPDKEANSNAKFEMELQPDDTYILKDFSYVPQGANRPVEIDKTVKGKIGFNSVVTPVGTFEFRPNGLYTNNRDQKMTIKVNVVPDKGAVEAYTSKLSADLENVDAEVIELSITDVNVQRAQDILETVIDVYNEFWVRDKNRMAVATSEFINERLNDIVKELEVVDNEIADFKKEHELVYMGMNATQSIEKNTALDSSYQTLNNEIAITKYLSDYISNPANANSVIPYNSNLGSNVLEQQISQYNTIILTMDNLRSNSSENNPLIKDYERQAKGMREALIKSIKTQLGTLTTHLNQVKQSLGDNKSKLASMPDEAKYMATIQRDQSVKEQLYLFLLQKREETNLTQAFNAYNTRIITPPYGPSAPISPKRGMTIIAAFMLGLLIPALWIYLKTISDTTVHSRSDLENLPIPFTGEIPLIGKKQRFKNLFRTKKAIQKIIDTPLPIVEEGKRDVPNEAFRVVRSNIELMLGTNHRHDVMAITSFNPGSGKSFICYNIGATFALRHKKVLLIDGDLRHGSLSTYVGTPSVGLTSYLSGQTNDLSKIIYPVKGIEGLSIIPIGKRAPNPAELIDSKKFGEMIETLKQEYDEVIIDCPPVNIVVDTQIINKYVDATLFVVRAGLFKRSTLNDISLLYQENKLKRMSLILNATDEAHSSYYTYGNYHQY